MLNDDGGHHRVKCNKSFVNSILVEGWSELAAYNEFSQNVEVVFGYYEHNLLCVEMFKEVIDSSCIPKFDNLSSNRVEIIVFDTHV